MKYILVFSFLFLFGFLQRGYGQQSDEALIRSLEHAEKDAILKGDTTNLKILMSSKIVVQNPENTIVGIRQI